MGQKPSSVSRDVSIEPFDQVFALTQYLVNLGIENNFEVLPDSHTFKRILNEERDGAKFEDVKLAPPQFTLSTADANVVQNGGPWVTFWLCFEHGLLSIEDTDEYFGLGDGRFAFNTPMSEFTTREVDPDSEEYIKVLGKNNGTRPGKLVALGVNLEEAHLDHYRNEGSNNDMATPSQEAEDVLKSLMSSTLQGIGEISYAFMKEGDDAEAIFDACAIRPLPYPWKDIEKNGASTFGLTDNSRLNSLLVAEMTDTNSMDLASTPQIGWNGNITSGRMEEKFNSPPESFGTFITSGRNFFQNFLLKKLQKLNKAFEPTITNVEAKADDFVNPWYRWNCDLRIGEGENDWDDDFYSFNNASEGTNDAPRWVFQSSSRPDQGMDYVGKDGWRAKLWCNAECETENIVTFQPGGDTVSIEGFTRIFFKVHWWKRTFDFDPNIDTTDTREWRTRWSVKIHLSHVDDGGLQMQFVWGNIDNDFQSTGLAGLSDFDNFTMDSIRAAMSRLNAEFRSLEEEVRRLNVCMLPAAGIFFLKNPVLGSEGELICGLDFNHAPSGECLDGHHTVNPAAPPRKEYTDFPSMDMPTALGEIKVNFPT